jgi:hypothetical protein
MVEGPQPTPSTLNPTFATLPVVVLVATSFHGKPVICGTPHKPPPVSATELIWAYVPSLLTTPLSVMPQLTLGAIGVLTLIVPGALKEDPAGPIVAAETMGERAAQMRATAPPRANVLMSFMICLPWLNGNEVAECRRQAVVFRNTVASPVDEPNCLYPCSLCNVIHAAARRHSSS